MHFIFFLESRDIITISQSMAFESFSKQTFSINKQILYVAEGNTENFHPRKLQKTQKIVLIMIGNENAVSHTE